MYVTMCIHKPLLIYVIYSFISFKYKLITNSSRDCYSEVSYFMVITINVINMLHKNALCSPKVSPFPQRNRVPMLLCAW